MRIAFNDTSTKVELGDTVELQGQEQEVVRCQETGVLMLNIDADQLQKGDLSFIKKIGLTISNPDTDKPIALGVDYTPNSFGSKVASFLGGLALGEAGSSSNDDSDFFTHSSYSGGGGLFGGGGSFGGFGGGGFSGGGASASF